MTLPPLPLPAHTFYPKRGKYQTFSADQMREYGAACAAAERERLTTDCAGLRLALNRAESRIQELLAEPQAEPVRECADNDSPWLICKPCAAVGRCAKFPVAWRSKEHINGEFDSGWKLTSNEPPQTPRTIAIEPLYANPSQQCQPLTKVQITELAEQCGYDGAVPTVRLAFQGFKLDDFARAIERAVTGEQK